MNIKFQLEDPSKLMATITITDTVENLMKLQGQLKEPTNVWPLCDFHIAITEVIYQARKGFYTNSSTEPDNT